jgi:pantetheine-phosphate adenylyltransferase
MKRQRIGVYAGSFDPFTNGHLDIVRQAIELFDRVIVLVAVNPSKNTLFTMQERVQMIDEVIKEEGFDTVEVAMWDGAIVDFAYGAQAKFLIRGLRTVSDFEAELMMAQVNAGIDPPCRTVFLPASQHAGLVSSTGVRSAALAGKFIRGALPSAVERRMRDKIADFPPKADPPLAEN